MIKSTIEENRSLKKTYKKLAHGKQKITTDKKSQIMNNYTIAIKRQKIQENHKKRSQL